ncbi:MAG: ABC transporter ATP-binding protein [Terriglobales bacterium]
MTPLLDVRNLHVHFATQAGEVCAVCDVSFTVGQGEVLGLVGESGSGKSVTALAIMRLLAPQARVSGQILFGGETGHPAEGGRAASLSTAGNGRSDLLVASDEHMRAVRGAGISMIFQEPMTALNPVMRVGDQIAEAVLAHGNSAGRKDAWERALQSMCDVGIPDHERRARDYPHQFSGGQRQRIMIAMAIVNRPQLLIADEPTTALDVTIQAQILDLLRELREKFGLAMLFISHDLAVVSQVSRRVAVMYAGSIVEMGEVGDIFHAAAHPYTRGLLDAVPTLKSERGRPLRTIEGTVPAGVALPPGCPFDPRCDFRVEQCARDLPPLVEIAPGHLARCPVVNC